MTGNQVQSEPKLTETSTSLLPWAMLICFFGIWILAGAVLVYLMFSLPSTTDRWITATLFLLYLIFSPSGLAVSMALLGVALVGCEAAAIGARFVTASYAPYVLAKNVAAIFHMKMPAWITSLTLGGTSSALVSYGKFKEAEKMLKEAMPEVEKDFGAGSDLWFELQLELAEAYTSTMRLKEAERILQRCEQEIAKSSNMLIHLRALTTYRRWAEVCEARGDFAASEQQYKQAIAQGQSAMEEISRSMDDLRGDVAIDMAITLCKAHDFERAQEAAEQAVKFKSSNFLQGIFLSKWNFANGMIELSRGNLDKAEEFFNAAMTRAKPYAVLYATEIADIISGLAAVEAARGNTDRAQEMFEEALATKKRVHGGNHSDVADVLEPYAECLRKGGDEHKARHMSETAQRIRDIARQS